MINVYTDGSCRGNHNTSIPSIGGWGYVITNTDTDRELHSWGQVRSATNREMELTAVVMALLSLQKRIDTPITINSDSEYVIKGVSEWMDSWKSNGWKNSNNKPVKNRDLWMDIDRLSAALDVSWVHVKGHTGIIGNELADSLANRGADGSYGRKFIKK